jgi:hypothetical protein
MKSFYCMSSFLYAAQPGTAEPSRACDGSFIYCVYNIFGYRSSKEWANRILITGEGASHPLSLFGEMNAFFM